MAAKTMAVANPTPEKIEAWKTEFQEVHKLKVADKVAYLRYPDRKTLSLAMTRLAKNDIVGGCEAILENCWLGGDEEIKVNNRLFMGAANKVVELIEAADATLEKL